MKRDNTRKQKKIVNNKFRYNTCEWIILSELFSEGARCVTILSEHHFQISRLR